jgi:hypothetical protein
VWSSILRDRLLLVWLALVAATVLSWGLGTGSSSPPHITASVLILVVAFVKVRLIGAHFMELRQAPLFLKTLFDLYCLILCLTLIGVFVAV